MKLVMDRMEKRRIAGLQIAVVKSNRLVLLQSCGVADLEFDHPVQRETRFLIASATKPFTGVAVMQLVEAGKVNRDDPVSRYLEDIPEAWSDVTIRQMLMHVSGLPDIINPATGKIIVPGDEDASWAKVVTLPMMFKPGSGYSYNQTNYVLLGRIIQKLTGKPFTQFIRERQFDVAGMPLATFADSYDVVPGRARAYSYVEMVDGKFRQGDIAKAVITEFPPSVRAGSSLTTTAEEIAHWIIALNEGRLLSAENRRTMWTVGQMPDGKPTVWALGWPAFPRTEHPAVAGIGGAMAAFYVYPEDDLAVVILTNVAGGQPEQFIEQVAQLYATEGGSSH